MRASIICSCYLGVNDTNEVSNYAICGEWQPWFKKIQYKCCPLWMALWTIIDCWYGQVTKTLQRAWSTDRFAYLQKMNLLNPSVELSTCKVFRYCGKKASRCWRCFSWVVMVSACCKILGSFVLAIWRTVLQSALHFRCTV